MRERQAGEELSENVTLENLDDAFDEIDELIERWEERLSFKNLALAKRYLKGELVIGANIGTVGGTSKQYRAIFQRELPIQGPKVNDRRLDLLARWSGDADIQRDGGVRGPYRNQQSVFVADIQFMDTPERVIPSTVWLEAGDQPSRLLAGGLYSWHTLCCEVSLSRREGELSGAVGDCAVCGDQSAGKKVQRRSHVVNGITDNCAPLYGDVFSHLDAEKVLPRLCLFIANDSIGLAIQEGPDLGLQIREVFFGPFDLYPNAEQRIGGHGITV